MFTKDHFYFSSSTELKPCKFLEINWISRYTYILCQKKKNINIQQARKSDKTNNFPKLDFQAYKSLKCAAKPAVNVRPNTLSSLSH